jgi:RNA polymerase sigma-70 factor (ECF subfamily)
MARTAYTRAGKQRQPPSPTEETVVLLRTDAHLIARSCKEPHAFAVLFDRHYAAIAGFLRRRVERALADELAAETFLQAFTARERYDTSHKDARPWLYGIAANLLRRHHRSEQRRLRAYARAVDPREAPVFEEIDARLDALAAQRELASALLALGPGERDVLLLHAWADLTYEQIARALAIPIGTVRSRLSRARRNACELLGACGEASGERLAVTGTAAREE